MNLEVLFEDKDIIVVVKPPGVPSQSDRSSAMDIVSYLKNKKNPYIGVIHRLDRPVGGVMVYAKSQIAAQKLSSQIQQGKVKKRYMAVVEGLVEAKEQSLIQWLVKDAKTNTSHLCTKDTPKAQKAMLNYIVLEESAIQEKSYSLLEVELLTGRHHQIRVQMAGMGHGIYGDTKYNESFKNLKGWFDIGLFSYYLSFIHPITGKRMDFKKVPDHFPYSQFQECRSKLR